MLFPLGRVVMTPGVQSSISPLQITDALKRHAKGDWGDVCAEDKRANNQSLKDGSRLLSSYKSIDGIKFWIITEADRSITTFLLPEEY